MNAEFNWWLLIVGLVLGAGLTWLVLADSSRREADIAERELELESRWIADALADAGRSIDDARVVEVLRLHRAYRSSPPPDDLDEPWPPAEADPPIEAGSSDQTARPTPFGGAEAARADRSAQENAPLR